MAANAQNCSNFLQTSIALASTIYQLSQNPEKQQLLFEELQNALPGQDSKVDVASQEKMPYLKACIKETLRMYPVIIGNGRNLQSDTVLAGYQVPKGVRPVPVVFKTPQIKDFEKTHTFQSREVALIKLC